MTESNHQKTYSSSKGRRKYQVITASVQDENLNLLSIRDQRKVIHEYNLKKPQPTILSLASKYNVSSRHISDIIRNQKTIIKVNRSSENEAEVLGTQRQEQIEFLNMVMYEYLERTLYHNVPVDDKKFQAKAEEVKDCIAILRFKPSYAWLIDFKKENGIQDFSMETLRRELKVKEVKRSCLDPVDMVRYVQQRNDAFPKQQKNPQTSSGPPKTVDFSENHDGDSRSKKDESTPQLRKNSKPKIVYEKVDEDPAPMTSNTDAIDEATIKIEVSNTQLSEYTGPQPMIQKTNEKAPSFLPTTKTQRAALDDKQSKPSIKETSETSDLPVVDLGSGSEDDEYLTIYEIIDDEAPTSPVADNTITSSPPPLSNVPNIDVSPNTGEVIAIKTEPQSNDGEPMETNANTTSTYTLSEGVIIKTETSPSPQIDEDIKPTIDELPEEFVFVNNNGTNHNPHSPSLAINKLNYCKSNLPDLLDEDIKPTIIFEKSEEVILGNNAGTNDHQHSSQILSTGKRQRSNSPLPDIDTMEEAMAHLKVLENYVMLKENFRAIGLIAQLEEAIKKPPAL